MSANELKPSARTLVIIPTYNEEENLPLIVERVQTAQPDVHILVVDDNSPDGTGDLADKLAAENEGSIFVMHREGKGGLGGAYIAGFHWGLERDYTVLCEMDADGSHAPEQLCRLLDRIDEGADMVLGSRYVPGGGNIYTRIVLGAKLNDITGGYRAYRREVLETIDLDAVGSVGYCFQIDLAWRAIQAGFTVVEVPITFTEREIGESKMSGNIITEAFGRVFLWGIQSRWKKLLTLLHLKK